MPASPHRLWHNRPPASGSARLNRLAACLVAFVAAFAVPAFAAAQTSPLIGQTVPLVLVLSNGETVPVGAVVRSLGAQ